MLLFKRVLEVVMKREQKEGKKGKIHLPLYATSLFLLDVTVSGTGYLAHHNVQVTALSDSYEQTVVEGKKMNDERKKKN